MIFNQVHPLRPFLWQHAQRGIEQRNKEEALQWQAPQVKHARLRDVMRAQSARDSIEGGR